MPADSTQSRAQKREPSSHEALAGNDSVQGFTIGGQEVEAHVYPELTFEDSLQRTSEQLASVFPGFLSVASSTASGAESASEIRSRLDGGLAADDAAGSAEESADPAAVENWQQGWQAGYAQGREEGLTAAREASVECETAESAVQQARQQLLQALDGFVDERERYFHDIEQEAVRMALAIAARILRREAQMDPLLLSGAVRVALGQLGESTSVRLVVPETDRVLWEESLRLTPGLRLRPEVIGDLRMELGECRIETGFGGADLSLHEQLREIERGFFDRVPQRAETSAHVAAPPTTQQAPPSAKPSADDAAQPESAPAFTSVSAPASVAADYAAGVLR